MRLSNGGFSEVAAADLGKYESPLIPKIYATL
jgi:hypothetical protein